MRCFVAIELPEGHRRELIRLLEAFPRDAAKWCSAAQLHVTLKFLGHVDESSLPRICEAVAAVSGASAPFEVSCGVCGAFPSAARPRVIHCGINDPDRGCERWLAAAEPSFEALGFAREQRAFTPHVTLGRIRNPRDGAAVRAVLMKGGPALARSIPRAPVLVDRITLFESQTLPSGAVYLPLQSAALGG